MRRAGRMLRAVAFATLLIAGPARAEGVTDLLGLLQPGSRPAFALGGDPFLSPLADGCGWWAASGLAAPSGVRLESAVGWPVAGDLGLEGHAVDWRLARSLPFGRRELGVAARVGELSRLARAGGADGAVRLGAASVRLDGAARLADALPGLTLQAAGPLWTQGALDRRGSLGAGARLAPWRRLAAQVHWEKARDPERFASDLYGEPVVASLNLGVERWQCDGRLSAPGRLAIEGSLARARFAALEPADGALVYQLAPAGTSAVDQLALAWGPTRNVRVLARWTSSALDAGGEALWGGVRFGHVSTARVRSRAWLAGVERGTERGRLLADAEVADGHLDARGTLESWPFTDALVDLLGLSAIGRAHAAARWHRVHLAGECVLGGRLAVRGGLSWYDALPSGALESWRPTFLVFGVSDYRSDPLPWRRAQLALASLGARWASPAVTAGLEVQQPVYGRTFRAAAAGDAGGETGATAPAAAPRPGRNGTGTQVRVTLARGW